MAEGKSFQAGDWDQVANTLKALADANRLRIFDLLMQGDTCNCELNEKLDLPPNLLSHHLRVLRKAGLVRSRRDVVDGRWIYYAANKERVAEWREWFARFLDPSRIQERQALCGPEGRPEMAGVCGTAEQGCRG